MAGGAWKVAYADFVTAMMALFMVLWISAQDEQILIATSSYFQNPFNSPMDATSGVLPFNSKKNSSSNDGDGGAKDKGQETTRPIEMAFLNSVAADFKRMLQIDQDTENKAMDIQVTSDGLRVTLFDRPNQRVFVGDTADFTEWGRFVLQSLAWSIDRHQLRVMIDGHTRSGLKSAAENYTAWELSTDRANAARRGLVHYAVSASLIERVTGFADTRPLQGEAVESEANQRITLSLSLGSRTKTKLEPPPNPPPAISATTLVQPPPSPPTS